MWAKVYATKWNFVLAGDKFRDAGESETMRPKFPKAFHKWMPNNFKLNGTLNLKYLLFQWETVTWPKNME